MDIDNLIIDGNGKTIDGANKSRIFIVTGKNVTLKNIIFKNGFSFQNYDNALNNHGGALRINQEANLTIDDCKFMDNESEEYSSAICNSGELNILTSEISNHASKKKGGAIYNIHGLLNVTNSTLSHNTAARGGAIHNKHGTLNMSGSKLLNNAADQPAAFGRFGVGGALHNDGGKMTISESLFSGNFAKSYGGAIFNGEGDLTITNSSFVENVTDDGSRGVLSSTEKGKGKVFEFISNEIGPRHISAEKCFNIDELKDNPIKYVNIKDCSFEGNKPYDLSSKTIDPESEWLRNYDLNDILGFDYQ